MSYISARKLVKIARSHIGTREHGNNLTAWGADYGLNGVAWCGVHVWACFKEAGVDLRAEGIQDAASTNLFDAQAKRAGWQAISRYGARTGDIVFYDFGDLDGSGPDTANDDDHVGIVSRASRAGYLRAVEGNTASGAGGSQANGDGVFERTRALSLVRHVYRPPYAALTAEMRAREKAAAAARKAAAARAAAAKKAAQTRAEQAKAAALAKKAAAARAAAAAAAALLLLGGGAAVVANDPAPKPAASSTPTATPTPTRSPYAPPTTHLAPKPTPTRKPKPAPRPVLHRILKYRAGHPIMRGADVRKVQVLVGLRGKAVDGDYGKTTAGRVRTYQRRHHLHPVDGQVGRDFARAAGWGWRP